MKKLLATILATSHALLSSTPALAADAVDYDKFNAAIGLKSGNTTIGGLLSSALPILIQIAGLILFGTLVMGGFTMLAGAADKESQEKGKKMITSALAGFAIIFVSFWIAQILQVIFKVNILS